MSHDINTLRIKAVANALDTLKEKVVFVGAPIQASQLTTAFFNSSSSISDDIKN